MMKCTCISIWIICTLCLFTLSIKAQQPFLKHYRVDDGLPSNEIYQVTQDNTLGHLLIATDRGAVRFDGYTFENIPLKSSSANNSFYYIYKDKKGKIYFSGLKGLLYEFKNDSLYEYANNKKITSLFHHSGLLIANTIAIHQDTTWISYNNDYSYNTQIGSSIIYPNGKVENWIKEPGIHFDIPRAFYYRHLSEKSFTSDPTKVFITWSDGNPSNDSILIDWPSGYIRRLFYEKAGEYDLFALGRKVLIYKHKQKIGEYHSSADILYMAILDNQVYLGLENDGVKVFEMVDDSFQGPVQYFLENLSVTSIYKDTQGGMWFSTHESGLFYKFPSAASFSPGKAAIKTIVKHKKRVYVGHQNGLISVYFQGKMVSEIQLPLGDGDALRSFSFNYNDSLIAMTNKGYIIHEKTKWKFYPSSSIHIISTNPKLAFSASKLHAEVNMTEGLNGKLINKIVLSKRIIAMHYDRKKQLWLGTWEGLFLVRNDSLIDLRGNNKIFNDRIVSIKELPDSSLLIASLGSGMIHLKDQRQNVIDVSKGLRSSIINAMETEGNNAWLGTNKGLTKIYVNNGTYTINHFGIGAGLPTADIHEFTINDNTIYLQWLNNLTLIPIDQLEKVPTSCNAYLTSVTINGKSFHAFPKKYLKYYENDLEFNFNSINLDAANEQIYHYQLLGFDNVWHSTNARSIKYTNLLPGTYTFHLKVSSGANTTSDTVATYTFVIHPAIWQKWWFPILVGLLILLSALILLKVWLRSVKQKNKLLVDLSESQQSALVQLINPHFLFNILNTIQGSVLKEDRINAASIISKFSRLMRMSLEMSKQKLVSLEEEITLIKNYMELELLRSPDKFYYQINISDNINASGVYIPTMLIQPFIENAIKHGIMHLSDRRGIIKIDILMRSSHLLCFVEDNGIGRAQSSIMNKNIRENHESSGIEITVNRLNLLSKQKGSTYIYNVIDMIDEENYPKGTKIVFSIPFKLHNDTD